MTKDIRFSNETKARETPELKNSEDLRKKQLELIDTAIQDVRNTQVNFFDVGSLVAHCEQSKMLITGLLTWKLRSRFPAVHAL